ncbi:hypothetical protein HF086_015988 [Spodoptera exigua]|uniref:AAA+ ATPase domain-containing protein n=1 Tax=Spodoptera exigua TaxID=7107 RepID=A0A922MPN6_SPOEX|nr:hypothetical protein HF086_015988 [Spodoptera exigua]
MASKTYKYFILTGEPGVGKTTLTKKLVKEIVGKGVKTSGFYTEEVRYDRIREGFDVVALDGARGRLARDQNLLKNPVKHKVGKYGVLVEEFEIIALPSLVKPNDSQAHLLVIDEIGKMEFFSEKFKNTIHNIFSPSSDYTVLATIPVRKSDQLIESIRNHKQARVWTVNKNINFRIFAEKT